ncbi:serine O-acetyltransferase [Prosthecochloris vibrioformis]|uniref:Serine acetyltransferase n=1 Tax=Prosthecochloris vibrioformis TaxID=1098 RepID=A0A5C4S1C0_PROVB|nr:serine acetyltransferase [Prosthecochloris vibrioformis]TNJ37009.1 serine acetyltransferase [Prosthecochloris vibrioformis]
MSISAPLPDWTREKKTKGKYEPGKFLLASIRRYQKLKLLGVVGHVLSKSAVLQHRFWSAVCGADIPINSQIGGGLMIPHPNGIVIHPEAVIGSNCLIMQQVTIGTAGNGTGTPIIEDNVDIGAGAKILGGIRIGSHARIGANAVVLKDVPEGTTAVGIPAEIKSCTGQDLRLRHV